MEKTTFGNRLEALLTEKGVERKALARDAGISVQAIGNYIKDVRKPDYDVTARIAKTLDVSADYLLGLSEGKITDPNINTARVTTGLSEEAIEKLQEWREWPEHYAIISHLITESAFDDFLHHVRHYLMLSNSIHSSENHEIRQLKEEDQYRTMEYLGIHNCSELTTAFLALKSNLDAEDIAKFYLQAAQEKITEAIKSLPPMTPTK